MTQRWFFLMLLLFVLGFFVVAERADHRNFFYVAIFLPAVIALLRFSDYRAYFLSRPVLIILFFLAYTALSAAWADHATWDDLYDMVRYLLFVPVFLFVIHAALGGDERRFDRLLLLCIVGVGFIALVTLFLFYQDNPFPRARVPALSRHGDVQTVAANMYGIFAIAGLSFLLGRRRLDLLTPLARGLLIVALVGLVAFLILSQTRGALVAMVAAGGLLLALERRWYLLGAAVLASIAVIGVFEFVDGLRGFFQRGHGPRPYIWADSLRQIMERPVLGYGRTADFVLDGRVKDFAHPHNVILFITLQTGVVGLLLWGAVTACIGQLAVRLGRKTGDWTLVVILAFGLVAMCFTSRDFLISPNVTWIVYWLPVGLIISESIRQGIVTVPRRRTARSAP